ncbi:YpbF family protein [Bacillus aquiflavi]|uniref:YpbF family protein n=1 Tax=Bacillus aquiflavi TaxID=2672567 RepID=UPI001CA96647|nr:YpbF family protein [Bacillus aquiflavi]UAC47104.1 YpbF family protein [Bacillus aquiflavi]
MELPIKELDDRTDQATKEILQQVVEKKQKFDLYKRNHLIILWITLLISFFFLAYLYYTIIKPYSYSFAAMFSSFVNHTMNLYFLVIAVGSYGLMNLLRDKKEKAETEYHELRCEIIDKSKDLWKKDDAWGNRHFVFEMMKKYYGINLYHESK